MFIYKEDDKSQGICESCKKVVSTTFKYAPLKYKGAIIPDVLQDFCDNCGESVSIPPQSTFKLKEFRESLSRSVEFRVPMHIIDILVAIGSSFLNVNPKPNSICRIISEFYLSKTLKHEFLYIHNKILKAITDDLTKGESKGRLSCVLNDTTYSALKLFAEKESVNIHVIEKSIIIAAKHDILDNDDKELAKEFRSFALSRL